MYERAEREPSLSDIHKLADALQTTACDLIGQPTDNPYYIAEDKADYNATPLFAEDIKDITAEFIDEYMKGLLKNMDTRKQIDIIIGLLTALKDPGMRQVSPATILKLISMVG